MAQKVREVMTSEPIALQSDVSIQEAAQQMRDCGIGDVLVLDGNQIRGMLTDRDITVRAVADGQNPETTTVGEICSEDLVFVGPDDEADRVVEMMRLRAVRRVPVIDGVRAIGVVSIGDMAMARDQRSALADISAAPPNI